MWILIGLVGIVVIVAVVWRLESRRQSLPCPVWLRWMVELDNPFTRTNRAAVIIERLELRPGMKALDIGCGPGRLAVPMAKVVGADGEVTALDIQAGMLDRVKQKAQSAGLSNIQTLRAGIGEGKTERERFDRVLMVTALGEIPNREAALKEAFEALKPGGRLSVTEVIFDPHFQRRGTVRRLAREAGFEELAFHGNPIAYNLVFEKPTNA